MEQVVPWRSRPPATPSFPLKIQVEHLKEQVAMLAGGTDAAELAEILRDKEELIALVGTVLIVSIYEVPFLILYLMLAAMCKHDFTIK